MSVLQSGFALLKKQYRKLRYYYWLYRTKNMGTPPQILNPEQTMVFLLPETGIQLFIRYFLTLASQFKQLGYHVYFVRCFNIFERCTFMDSESLPINASIADKKMLCTYCYRSHHKHVTEQGFDSIDLRLYAQPEDYQEIKGQKFHLDERQVISDILCGKI